VIFKAITSPARLSQHTRPAMHRVNAFLTPRAAPKRTQQHFFFALHAAKKGAGR